MLIIHTWMVKYLQEYFCEYILFLIENFVNQYLIYYLIGDGQVPHNFKPLILAKVILDFLPVLHRLESYDFHKIKKYRDKAFQKLIKYAYTVPLYKEKYKVAGIHPSDIKGIDDIEKLPTIHRQDIIDNFPKGVIPPGAEKKSIIVNTSGSTRNPVTYYTDQYSLMKTLILYVRELRYYGFNWNKSRISIIANFYSQTGPTRMIDSGAKSTLKPLFSLNNIQILNADDDLTEMINTIDKFKPEFIAGFPGPIRHLALLRKKGYGKNINPKCFISSGGGITKYQKMNVEETFGARVYDLYGSTEAGSISFECEEGNYHINSDFVYLEVIDVNGNVLPKGKSGRLAITKLYGKGTPLIRYTGMGDIITLKDEICSCGLQTDLIEKVHGRIKECVVLPDKRVIFPDQLSHIAGKVMFDLKTDKISRIQVVQESLDKIEILVIIDESMKNIPPSVEKLFNELQSGYKKLLGSEITIEVKEVTKLRGEESNPESTPGILSKIDPNKYV